MYLFVRFRQCRRQPSSLLPSHPHHQPSKHVVVKGKVEGMESTVFGLTRFESDAVDRSLAKFGGRIGQDGQMYKHPPLHIICELENLFGYRILTSSMGTHQSAIWTLHRPI